MSVPAEKAKSLEEIPGQHAAQGDGIGDRTESGKDKRYGESARTIETKVELFSLNALDMTQHTFSASVYVQLRAKKGTMTVEAMEKLNVEFLNLKSTDKDKRNSSDDDEYICQHIVVCGDFCSHLSLVNFPMDSQSLEIKFEVWDENDMSSPMTPVGYNMSMAKGFLLEESFLLVPKVEEIVEEVGDVPVFHMRMTIKRKIGFYVFNYIVPIFMMTSLSFTAIGIDLDSTGDRLQTVLTLLLTVVAYKMALADNLPCISTPCKLDYFMAGSFFLMFWITIILALVKVLGDTVDTIVACLALPWVLWNLFCVYEMWRYAHVERSKDTDMEGYKPLN